MILRIMSIFAANSDNNAL